MYFLWLLETHGYLFDECLLIWNQRGLLGNRTSSKNKHSNVYTVGFAFSETIVSKTFVWVSTISQTSFENVVEHNRCTKTTSHTSYTFCFSAKLFFVHT